MAPRSFLAAWTFTNLLLTVVLGLGWWLARPPAPVPVPLADPTTTALPALAPGDVLFAVPNGDQQLFVATIAVPLELPTGSESATPAPEGLLRFHPGITGTTRLIGTRRIEFVPDGPWPAAVRIEALLDPEARTTDGRRLGAQRVRFIPRPLAIDSLTIRNGDEGFQAEGHLLGLRFSLPVSADALRAALAAEGGWSIPALDRESDDGRQWLVTVTPDEQASHEEIVLRLAGSLIPSGGGESLGEDRRASVRLQESVALSELSLADDGIVFRSRHQLATPAEGLLTLTPPRVIRWETRHDGLFARCDLTPGELVRISAPAGFPGRGRFRIAAPIEDVLRVGDAKPDLAFAQAGTVLSAKALPLVDITATNVPRLRLALRKVYDNNQVRFAERSWSVPDAACTPWRRRDRDLPGPRNQPVEIAIDLRELWGEAVLPSGWYEVELSDGDSHAWATRKVIQVSDLACVVRSDGGDLALRVWSLADGTPIADAEVQVLTRTNQRLVDGRTDTEGLCRLSHSTRADDEVPHVVLLRLGEDRLAIDLARFRLDLQGDRLGGETDPVDGLTGWAWSERGLVRPGEDLRVAAMLRDENGRAPLGTPVELRLISPDRQRAATIPLPCPADGLVTSTHRLDPQAPQGTWRWELWRAGSQPRQLAVAWSRVEPFVPDRITATAAFSPLGADHVVTDRAELRLVTDVRFTTGEPAEGAGLEADLRVQAGTWNPPGTEGVSFSKTPGTENDETIPLGVIAQRRLTTDAEGRAQWRCDLPQATGHQVLSVAMTGNAIDPGGRPLPVAASAIVVLEPVLLGVRCREKDGAVTASAVVCDPTGADADPRGILSLRLERRRWDWDLRTLNGRLRWSTRIVGEEVGAAQVVLPGATVGWPIPETDQGWLVAVLERDGQVWAEQVLGGTMPEPPDRLRCTVAGEVAPGTTAELLVTSPLAGQALVTLEGLGIHQVASVAILAGDNRIPLTIPSGITRPNLHAVVMVAAAQREHGDGALWLAGGTRVTLARSERRIPVEISAPTEATPEVPLLIRVHAPGARRAVIAAVDDAVLARTRHPVPDPAGRFAAERAISGGGATSLSDLLERPRWPLVPGGDGDEDDDPYSAALAQRGADLDHLGACALWRLIDLDAFGDGSVELPVDGFEGRLRLVAIVAGLEATGGGRADSLLRAPLGLRLALPRLLAPGDQAEAVVTITARTGDGVATLGGDGGAALALGPWPVLPRLNKDRPYTFTVPVTAVSAADDAVITLRASLTGDDGARLERQIQARLPVRPAARWVEDHAVVTVDGATRWALPGTWAGTATVHLEVPRDRRDELRPALDTLVAYPFGCGEQVASQVLVLAACAGLVDRDGSAEGAARAAGLLPHGVTHLLGLADPGGFTLWPGDRDAHPVASVHILRALLAAERAGSPILAAERETWLDALEGLVRREERGLLRCQGIATLAEGGRRVGPWIDSLATRSQGDLEQCAWLALAALANGDRDRAGHLLRAADLASAVAKRDGDGLWRSPWRCDAVELRARVLLDPADPRVAILAERLLAAVRSPKRLTTQELAQVLPALDAWLAVQRSAGPPPAIAVGADTLAPGDSRELVLAAGAGLALSAERPGTLLVSFRGWRIDSDQEAHPTVRLSRRIRTWEDGQPVERLVRGRLYAVELTLASTRALPTLVLTDLLGAGLEAEPNPSQQPAWEIDAGNAAAASLTASRVENHDDRMIAILDGAQPGTSRYLHCVRAVASGTYHVGPPAIEAFYDPEVAAVGEPLTVEILP